MACYILRMTTLNNLPMNTSILPLLQELMGPSITQKDECIFACPFCHHPKKKLSINIVTNKWKCWVCGAKGGHILWLLKKLNVSKTLLLKFKNALGDIDIQQYKTTVADTQLLLPPEYKPLWVSQKSYPYLHALSYLKARNVRTDDILRYRMGYCETGNYAGRIIIPSYDKHGQLNYFVARSFYEENMKYKNPPVSKNIVVFENLISWNEPIVLVEGVYDAIAIRRNAIPMLGKFLPTALKTALVGNNVKEVYVFLDNDAKVDATRIQQQLIQYDIATKVVFPDTLDAADMGFTKSWEYINNARTVNFKEAIEQKLQNI
jgi:DNA primase